MAGLQHLPEESVQRPGVLEAYARRAIRNRIVDEIRRARIGEVYSSERLHCVADSRAGPLETAIETDLQRRFREALLRLSEAEQLLVVGRLELNLSYEVLAAVCERPSVAATRIATRRAVMKIARDLG